MALAAGGLAQAQQAAELAFIGRFGLAVDPADDGPASDLSASRLELSGTARGPLGEEGRWFLGLSGEHLGWVGRDGSVEATWQVLPAESGVIGPLGGVRGRAGLLVERWGRLDLLPVADVWNAKDLRSGPLVAPDALRRPTPTLALELGKPTARATLLWGPFPGQDLGTTWGTDWSLIRPGMLEELLADAATWEGDALSTGLLQQGVTDLGALLADIEPATRRGLVAGLGSQGRPEDLGWNGDFALRLAAEGPSMDGALTAAWLRSRVPMTQAHSDLLQYLKEERLPTLVDLDEGLLARDALATTWPHSAHIAIEGTTVLGPVGLRAEGAWRSAEVVRQPWLQATTCPSLAGGVGLDWASGSWLVVVVEGRLTQLIEAPDDLWLTSSTDAQLALGARLSLLADRLRVVPGGVVDVLRAEALGRIEASWRVDDAVELGVGGLVLLGPAPPLTFQEAMSWTGGPFGYWGDNDAVTAHVTWIR